MGGWWWTMDWTCKMVSWLWVPQTSERDDLHWESQGKYKQIRIHCSISLGWVGRSGNFKKQLCYHPRNRPIILPWTNRPKRGLLSGVSATKNIKNFCIILYTFIHISDHTYRNSNNNNWGKLRKQEMFSKGFGGHICKLIESCNKILDFYML